MKKLWTLEEDNMLIEFAKKGVKLSKIADKLDRTENAVRLRCKRLGVQIMAKGRHWTKEEEAIFSQEWVDEDVSNNTLVRRHNRTWHALQEKAFAMGLGSRPLDSQYITVQDVCAEMNVSSDRVYAWVKAGLKTRKSNNKRTKYMIDTDDLLVFLENHQNLFNAADVSLYLFYDEPQWLKDKRKSESGRSMDNHQTEWTDADDRKLLMRYKHGNSIAELAKQFKRSECAIITHLNVLGCERKRANCYTEHEIELLRKYSDKKTLQELVTMMPGRTVKGLEYKCKMLKLPYHLSAKNCNA